jgi:hypothetical protein
LATASPTVSESGWLPNSLSVTVSTGASIVVLRSISAKTPRFKGPGRLIYCTLIVSVWETN